MSIYTIYRTYINQPNLHVTCQYVTVSKPSLITIAQYNIIIIIILEHNSLSPKTGIPADR